MNRIQFDDTHALVRPEEKTYFEPLVRAAHEQLHGANGAGAEYTGWLHQPSGYDREELRRVQAAASRINEMADVLVVIGIGGSYLGAKTAIDALTHSFYNELPKSQRGGAKIYFAGNHISGTYLSDLMALIENQSVCLNVISKSGTTTEPAIAFRILKKALEARYGETEAAKRIFATTDARKGALRTLADEKGYETFVIPDSVGGRYSVITPVGWLPMAVAGIDIEAFMEGAEAGERAYANPQLSENVCYQYALARNVLRTRGKSIEVLVTYEPSMAFLSEWWMQLYGESEGKDGKGIFPTKMNNTTDLHSMGQMIQDGPRIMMETVVRVETPETDIILEKEASDLDGLNYLAGMPMSTVNKNAFMGTLQAHVDGAVPNMVITLDRLDAYSLGQLMYFFMKACGISGYMLGVNPFNQPGVEAYKKNMFRLLGKPES